MRILITAVLAASAAGGHAMDGTSSGTESPAPITPLTVDRLQWMPAPPDVGGGAQIAVLSGDPAASGPFTARLRFPAGFRMQPHTHPVDARVTVLVGEFRIGVGETFASDALTACPAGSFHITPAEVPHYTTTDVETVIQIDAIGPWGTEYCDPAMHPAPR